MQKITGRDASENASGFVNLFLIALATFSTAYNVVLYVFNNPTIKKAMLDFLKCASTSELLGTQSSSQRTLKTTRVSPHGNEYTVKGTTTDHSQMFTVQTQLNSIIN